MIIAKKYAGEKAPESGAIKYVNDISLRQKLNGECSLDFTVPISQFMTVCSLISFAGQEYRVYNVMPEYSDAIKKIKCRHVFEYDAKKAYISNIGSTDTDDYIGVDIYKVISDAVTIANNSVPGFELFTDAELSALGMKRAECVIDFTSTDKTNLWDVIQDVIELAGKGELYINNKKFALVERIGSESGEIVVTSKISGNVSIEYDASDMITKLYPYGTDSLEITNASANTSKTDYILSSNSSVYGIYGGYKNYEISDVDELFTRAVWDFDESNPNRLDVPTVSIQGNVADIGLSSKLKLGDSVRLMLSGTTFTERVIELTRYPYSGKPPDVTIGRMKKDLFFYLNQIGILSKKYKKVSAVNGNIFDGNVLKGGTTL